MFLYSWNLPYSVTQIVQREHRFPSRLLHFPSPDSRSWCHRVLFCSPGQPGDPLIGSSLPLPSHSFHRPLPPVGHLITECPHPLSPKWSGRMSYCSHSRLVFLHSFVTLVIVGIFRATYLALLSLSIPRNSSLFTSESSNAKYPTEAVNTRGSPWSSRPN